MGGTSQNRGMYKHLLNVNPFPWYTRTPTNAFAMRYKKIECLE